MKLNFNFDGKTFLSKWWKIVRDNFTTIQTDHNTLSDKLDTEITQRTNADVGLANQIAAEKTARESADSSLSSRISNEVTIRQAADNELQRNISSEATDRENADQTLQGNIDAEAKNRRVGDSELREQILTEQTNRTNADDILNGEKADKTDLYGKETDVVHTITHSLEKSDLSIDINTSYGDGTITINSLAVQTKIFLDGNAAIQTEPISASFSAEKGEEGEKWVNLLYDQYTGKLGLEVTEQPEAGNVAKIAVTYMKAEVAEMYAGQLKFDGIKDLRALKTDNKNSFLEAVNEIATKLTTEMSDRMDGHDSLSDRINTETGERQAADMQLSARIDSIGNKAPLNHASTGTTYGVGDATNYGHLKLSDSVNSSNSTGNGCAATPKATKTAYDKAVEAYELANQNQYTHPSTHPASMIVQDSTHRFVSDDETSDWDNKLDANFISNGYAGIDEVTTTLNDMWSDRVAPPTTITISSSTSKHMLTADYYCSGTNDQTVINNAISALPSTGGKIVLLEGTYNIGGTITINKSNVTIQGLGHNVILKTATSTTALKMFGISNATGLIISDIVIDYANNTSADCIAIQLYSSDNVIIEHINILNNKGNGIEWFNCNYTRFSDISFINVRQCIWDRGRNHSSIIDKWIVDTVTNGITLDSSSTLNKIVDCIVRSATDNGIKSDAAYTMINDNIVYGCSNGITVNGNCSTVADNNVRDSDIGISVNGKYVNVSGNTAIRADDSGNVSSYSSSQYTISMGSSSANCLVIGNIISGKNYTNNGASTNTFANNKY